MSRPAAFATFAVLALAGAALTSDGRSAGDETSAIQEAVGPIEPPGTILLASLEAGLTIVPAPPVRSPGVPVPPPVMLADPGAPEVTAVREAVLAYRRADLQNGDRIRSGVSDPAAGTLLDWTAVRYGGPLVGFDRVAGFLRDNPAWPASGWTRRRAEEMLVAEGRPAETVRAFFARERPQTPGGKLALAGAFRADGRKDEAIRLVRDAWRTDTFGRELEGRILGEFGDALTAADHRFRMERLLFKENWEGARRAADLAGKGFDALVKARIAVSGKAANAGKLVEAVPAALKGDASFLYSRAQFLRRAEKPGEAAKVMAGATRDPALLVDGDEWWTERRIVARKLLDGGDAKAAYATVAGHAAESPEKRIEAEFHAGWIALRFLKDPAVASGHFARAAEIAATPISVARAAFWRGRAAEEAGAGTEARAFYGEAARQGTTYYGQLAAAKLGTPELLIRSGTDPASPERIAAAKAPAVQAIGLLYAAGLRDVASPLIADLARNGQDLAELDAVGDLALAYRDARSLLALGKAATQRGLPLDEEAFPTIGIPAYEPASAPRVEASMVHAIARQESAFDPAAGSGAGARGLMQLMPATAQATARKFGVEFDASRLLDASYNARLGSAHLGDLMESWKGSYILTFASYNAGPGNVRKWIEAYGDPRDPGVDAVDWVERIPFSETRNYVQRVMENLQVYRRRLGTRSALLTDRDLKPGAAP